MNIELKTNDPKKSLVMQNIARQKSDRPREHGPEADYSTYYEVDLSVSSDWLSFRTNLLFQKIYVREAIANLIAMSQGIPGEARLGSEYEPVFILFTSDDLGHLTVSGKVPDVGDYHSATFAIKTDQTVLPYLISDLSEILKL